MELVAAILVAGPLGYFLTPRGRSLMAYGAVWIVLFPIQTAVVHAENPDDIVALYFVFNALILGLGIALNTLGAWLRSRRLQSAGGV